MGKAKRKCKAWSKAAMWCDGCHTHSSKCPMREKQRDRRAEQKRSAKIEARKGVMTHESERTASVA